MCSGRDLREFLRFQFTRKLKKWVSKFTSKFLVNYWSLSYTLSLSPSFPLLPSLALLSIYVDYVDDQKEIFGRSLVATIGYGGCAIS